MSIVEKAIEKLHAARAARRPVTPAPPPSVPARAPAAVSLPTVARPVRERTNGGTREILQLDLSWLRSRGLLPSEDANAQVMDECRRIKWPLLAKAFGRDTPSIERGNVIMIASCVPNEGKTFMATTLAMTIAMERDCTVLLIDGDAAKPNITRDFRMEGRPGLIEALAGDSIDAEELVVDTSVAGLSFLPAGHRNPRAPELFASQRMDEVAARLAANDPNRIIIIDSSPLLATNEAQALAHVVGQILVVVRASHTLQPILREALGLLDATKAISLMLNQTEPSFGQYYGGYYGYEKQQ